MRHFFLHAYNGDENGTELSFFCQLKKNTSSKEFEQTHLEHCGVVVLEREPERGDGRGVLEPYHKPSRRGAAVPSRP